MTLQVLSLSGALKKRPWLIEIYSFKKKKLSHMYMCLPMVNIDFWSSFRVLFKHFCTRPQTINPPNILSLSFPNLHANLTYSQSF